MEANIKLVIFDLDGTLVNLPIDYNKLKDEFAKILKTDNLTPISEKLSKIDDDMRKKVFEVWTRFEFEALPRMEVIKEGIELYRKFNDKIRSLVTLQGRKITMVILERTRLSFDFIVTREDSLLRSKQIEMVIRKFGVNPDNVLVIADRRSDKEAAEKIGCRFIYVR